MKRAFSAIASCCAVLGGTVVAPDQDVPNWDLWMSTQLGETDGPRKLIVEGSIPEWVKGSLVRLGPAQYQVGNRSLQHQMDGYGKLSNFRINGNEVQFQTRFLRSSTFVESQNMNDVVPHLTFMPTDPPFTWKDEGVLMSGPSDNNPIFPWCTGFDSGDICFACSDGASPVAFDPVTLNTIGYYNYTTADGKAHEGKPVADAIGGAHRLREVDGEATIGWQVLQMMPIPFQQKVLQMYKDVRVDGKIERRFFGAVNVPRLPVIHSLGSSRNYVIAVVPPMGIDFLKMLMNRDQISAMAYKGSEPTFIYVFDLHSTQEDKQPVKIYQVPAFYVNHHINAYETTSADGKPLLVFDLIAYKDGSFLSNPLSPSTTYVSHNATLLRSVRGSYAQIVRRFTLAMGEAAADSNVTWVDMPLYDAGTTNEMQVEMPRFDEKRFQGLKSCIFWAQGIPKDDPTYKLFNLVKADLCTPVGEMEGRLAIVWKKDNHLPTEPIFVPRPGATDEDDGVLLATVFDGDRAESYLLVLDAATMSQLAVAYSGYVVPVDFHGQFFPLTAGEALRATAVLV